MRCRTLDVGEMSVVAFVRRRGHMTWGRCRWEGRSCVRPARTSADRPDGRIAAVRAGKAVQVVARRRHVAAHSCESGKRKGMVAPATARRSPYRLWGEPPASDAIDRLGAEERTRHAKVQDVGGTGVCAVLVVFAADKLAHGPNDHLVDPGRDRNVVGVAGHELKNQTAQRTRPTRGCA